MQPTFLGYDVDFKTGFLFDYAPPGGWPVASECEELVVGEMYLVPCVRGVPVIGDPHVDDDHFNHTEHHYHCDSRFYDGDLGPYAYGGPANCAMRASGGPPVLEPHRCIRTTPSDFTDDLLAVCQMALHANYGFTEAKCGRCPHKGMPIVNGVCSGHRLRWLADGTIKHKPPYTFQIRGTANKLVISERTELQRIEIPIVEDFSGSVTLDMLDRDGELVHRREFGLINLRARDKFNVVDNAITKQAETAVR